MFDEKFWLAIAFLTFLALIIKYVVPQILKQLDEKSKQIAKEMLEAKEMKEKALNLLELSKKQYQESLEISNKLLKDAIIEAESLVKDAKTSASDEIAKKMSAFEARLKQEEVNAIKDLKLKIINSAINFIENSTQNSKQNASSDLIKKSISDTSKLIH